MSVCQFQQLVAKWSWKYCHNTVTKIKGQVCSRWPRVY